MTKELNLTNATHSWQMFKQRLKDMKVFVKQEKPDNGKVALLNAVGEEALNLFNKFGLDYETCKLEDVRSASNAQLSPKSNSI